jgi:hypothetical protein
MYYITLISFWIVSFFGLGSAKPVGKALNPHPLTVRSPVSDDAFSSSTDWPTNVVMVGGSQTYGMYVPEDGTWYDLGTIQCLGIPADAIGPCNGVTIDQIGVVSPNGPCSFVGNNGYSETIQGTAGEGYYTVGPPQNILQAKCGS